MRICFIESPTGIVASDPFWDSVISFCEKNSVESLVLNEMPVGSWVAEKPIFDMNQAQKSLTSHNELIEKFRKVPFSVFGTRPVLETPLLANEAFVLDEESYQPVHHKTHFPSEKGFFETTWFQNKPSVFSPVNVKGINFGFLICTELMFTETARFYAGEGVHIILAPRATGGDLSMWKTAASMAAIVSGSYIISSNRVGTTEDGLTFNGGGFAFGPDGLLFDQTTSHHPFKIIDVNVERVRQQRSEYPCYITLSQLPGHCSK